jgi:hypothetical protein
MKSKELSILTYNTCYGLKANTLFDAYNATWRIVHKRKDPKEISAKSDFEGAFQMINDLSPDILILNEIFDDLQTIPVKKKLCEMGYCNVFIGDSGHHDKPICVSTLIATKEKCCKLNIKFIDFPKGIPGTGGGAVSVEFKDLNLFVLGCHVACMENCLQNQLPEMDIFFESIKNKYSNIIFAGDFNRNAKFYMNNSEFIKNMNYVKSKRTFPSFFPWYKPFKIFSKNIISGQIDNIFYKGNIEILNNKVIKGRSDHKALFVKLKIGE